MSKPYTVEMAPGCYQGPTAPVVSRHSTLALAVKRARSSDRYCVWGPKLNGRNARLYTPPERDDPRVGYGRYGNGPKAGEPSLAECVVAAEAARK